MASSSIELGHRGSFPSSDVANEDGISRIPAPDNAQPAMLPVSRRYQFVVLMCSFLDIVLTIGLNQAYGVFLTYYLDPELTSREAFLPPQQVKNKALVAFVGTLAAGLTWGGSIFVNPIMARTKKTWKITVIGAILMGAGYTLASFAHNIWELLLTQGLIYGVGTSMLYFPVLSVAPEYFDTHRGSAMGFILSGAGIGGLIYAPVTRALLAKLGIRWTLRLLGGVNFAIAMPIALTTPPSRSLTRRPTLVNIGLAKKPAFVLQAFAAMTQAAGNYVPLTFLSEFSTTLGHNAAFGAALLAIMNGINSASRVMMGAVADKAGRQNTLIFSVLGSAVTVIAFWFVSAAKSNGTGFWLAFVVTYGVFSGGYNSLFPTTVIEVFGTQAYASVNGFIYFIRGLGVLWGSPVGGALIVSEAATATPKSYINLIWYDFSLLMLSSLCVVAVRGFDAAEKGRFRLKA